METPTFKALDGNEAVARVAYALNEVIAIYPITPASPMGEWADAWAAGQKPNLWGTVPAIVEMQSEGGVAGAVHGALQTGALTTTFTASQGLLLMLPNLYKIAGELTPAVFHIAARSVAAQALSIFGDHSDVMAARSTGCAMLCSASVQEAQDMAAIATAATLTSRIPFIHFFDGFRTSHEIQKIELLHEEVLRSLISEPAIQAHRQRALSPDHPVIRGTAQNPDVFFQAREAVNPYYRDCMDAVATVMEQFGRLTGREYQPFEYHGDPEAARVIVLMGSGCETVQETVDYLNRRGGRVGLLKVRLYRPFDSRRFVAALPETVQAIAVLDRTKEPGSVGEPLYLDVVAAIAEQPPARLDGSLPLIVGGRYGLSSKEFTPAMVKAVFDNLDCHPGTLSDDARAWAAPMHRKPPKNHFTIGINDDVTHTSLVFDPSFSIEPDSVIRAVFFGLGADGTVGANKNSIKIIGEETENYAQGYFVYDSKKSGSVTVSHLRFGPDPIHAPYLIERANLVACHQWEFLTKVDVLKTAVEGATLLINAPYPPETIWERLPERVQAQVVQKRLKVSTINASKVAREAGIGGHINTVMQVCFFALAGVLPREEAIAAIQAAIRKTYGKKGEAIVAMNLKAVDQTLKHLFTLDVPTLAQQLSKADIPALPCPVSDAAPDFARDVLGQMLLRQGDALPVSALPADGTYPTGTSRWEKRNIAQTIPVWDPEVCVQCGKCVMACPHGVIRGKVYEPGLLAEAPAGFKSTDARERDWAGLKYSLQVAAEDCTGCGICVDVCPAKNRQQPKFKAINMTPVYGESIATDPAESSAVETAGVEAPTDLRQQEQPNWDFFLNLPNPDRLKLNLHKISQQQLQEPLFEFSGACAGCGETPYLKLVSQLFGDRALIANATGCSSIYGGNLPTTPWAHNDEGRGPAWSNSLFEDNAEFGLGFRVSIDKQTEYAQELLQTVSQKIDREQAYLALLAEAILTAPQDDEAEIVEQRDRVVRLKKCLHDWLEHPGNDPAARRSPLISQQLLSNVKSLYDLADYLVKKSVWIIGGDGWAYDIGYGGLDHVLASGRNVNLLVLDTEVYSNTGGQQSKATPKGAVAKFAAAGKPNAKKDLGLMAMTYGNVYVASLAMGARDEHTLKALIEAESYNGPSLIIAYSHCIAHGINMATAMHHQKTLVDSGRWLLYRYDPRRRDEEGKSPLIVDSRSPQRPVEVSLYAENRFKMLTHSHPETAQALLKEIQADVRSHWQHYDSLVTLNGGKS